MQMPSMKSSRDINKAIGYGSSFRKCVVGMSYMAEYYGISSIEEARAYLDHPILKARLIEISTALLQHKGKSAAYEILGTIDAIKVRSCMTLFDHIMPNAIFSEVLNAFYNSERDELTLNLLK
jgi:uncharacterized protein (DUF1810 family)